MFDIFTEQSFILEFSLLLFHLVGILAALDAFLFVRSSQGVIAWALSLILFPYVALPIYLVFGRRKFQGFRRLARKMNEARCNVYNSSRVIDTASTHTYQSLERTVSSKFVIGNKLKLLTDGESFFNSLLTDIRAAKECIWLCFYLVRADNIGIALKNELLLARKRGVSVWFLYDELGSLFLSKSYLQELQEAGVEIVDFGTRKGSWNYFQLNFRNHRKIVLIDRSLAYVGGFNVGDEYLGRSRRYGQWRDTQLKLEGPAVSEIEAVFLADWSWATQKTFNLTPVTQKIVGSTEVLTVATGPIDELDRAVLFFLELINSAKERLWIASPYFVPNEAILEALNLAAMRGVEVRLLLPEKSDNILVSLAGLFFISEVSRHGVECYRYQSGFMHQKTALVDNKLAVVGTSNLDNRSLHLSFEINLVATNSNFISEIESMLETDFSNSRLILEPDLDSAPFYLRLGSGFARLFSPIL